jgi:hypothetical protein
VCDTTTLNYGTHIGPLGPKACGHFKVSMCLSPVPMSTNCQLLVVSSPFLVLKSTRPCNMPA